MSIEYQAKDELELAVVMCPVLTQIGHLANGKSEPLYLYCIGADCALWDAECQWCCIRSISHEPVAISDWFKELTELMSRRH